MTADDTTQSIRRRRFFVVIVDDAEHGLVEPKCDVGGERMQAASRLDRDRADPTHEAIGPISGNCQWAMSHVAQRLHQSQRAGDLRLEGRKSSSVEKTHDAIDLFEGRRLLGAAGIEGGNEGLVLRERLDDPSASHEHRRVWQRRKDVVDDGRGVVVGRNLRDEGAARVGLHHVVPGFLEVVVGETTDAGPGDLRSEG